MVGVYVFLPSCYKTVNGNFNNRRQIIHTCPLTLVKHVGLSLVQVRDTLEQGHRKPVPMGGMMM